MTDGRVLIGAFVCTDKDRNVILGGTTEYIKAREDGREAEEDGRNLGLAMIPGHCIVKISLDSSMNQ